MVFYTNCTICWCQQTSFSTKSLLNMPKKIAFELFPSKSHDLENQIFCCCFSLTFCVYLLFSLAFCVYFLVGCIYHAFSYSMQSQKFVFVVNSMVWHVKFQKEQIEIFITRLLQIFFLWQFRVTMTDRYACIVFIQCASHWNFEINMHICRMLSVLMEWKKIFWFWIILMRYPHSGCPRLLFLILLLLLLSKVKIPMILFVTYSRTLFHTLFHIFTFTYAYTHIHKYLDLPIHTTSESEKNKYFHWTFVHNVVRMWWFNK